MKYSLFSTERQVTLLYVEVPYGPLIEKQIRHERYFKPEALVSSTRYSTLFSGWQNL